MASRTPAAFPSAEPAVASPEPGEDEAFEGAISPTRLGAFSDGVIAIAVTLLILDVRIPSSDQAVWSALRDELPAIAAFASTFLIIGIAWIHHHNLFHQVRAVDRTMLFVNLGMLLTVSFLPLPTATLGNHLSGSDGTAAGVFWGLSMAVLSGWFVVFWAHLARHPELLVPAARAVARARVRGSLLGPATYLLSALLALISPYATIGLSAALIVYFIAAPMAPANATRISGNDGNAGLTS